MKALLQQRSDLENELKHLEIEVPKLQAAWRAIPSQYNQFGNAIGSPEGRAAMDAASDADARARAIPSKIKQLDKEIAYHESVANIKKTGSAARLAIAENAALIEELHSRQTNLSKRLELTRTAAEEAISAAKRAEESAVSAYAQTVISEDSELEQASLAAVNKAVMNLTEAQDHDRRQQMVISALQAEIDKNRSQIEEAQQNHDAAKRQALSTVDLALSVEWDAAVERLMDLGAKMIAARNYNNIPHDGLSDLKIPRFSAGKSWSIGRTEIVEKATAVTLESLLAA